MNINPFKKKITTEEKFEQEKKERALTTIIRIFRNDKLKVPETDLSRAMIGFCNQIDPDRTMPERELIQKLQEREDILQFLASINNGLEVLDDNTVKAYAEKYYTLLREVLSSPDPKAWDAWEYQSQQTITILSLKNINVFKDHLNCIMDADKSCPFYVKKFMNELLYVGPKTVDVEGKRSPVPVSVGPTKEEEKTAEKIMRMVCPELEKSNKYVFRALVDSLKWRGPLDLKRTLEAVEKTPPNKRKLRGRESCVFIETDETVHYVG